MESLRNATSLSQWRSQGQQQDLAVMETTRCAVCELEGELEEENCSHLKLLRWIKDNDKNKLFIISAPAISQCSVYSTWYWLVIKI